MLIWYLLNSGICSLKKNHINTWTWIRCLLLENSSADLYVKISFQSQYFVSLFNILILISYQTKLRRLCGQQTNHPILLKILRYHLLCYKLSFDKKTPKSWVYFLYLGWRDGWLLLSFFNNTIESISPPFYGDKHSLDLVTTIQAF